MPNKEFFNERFDQLVDMTSEEVEASKESVNKIDTLAKRIGQSVKKEERTGETLTEQFQKAQENQNIVDRPDTTLADILRQEFDGLKETVKEDEEREDGQSFGDSVIDTIEGGGEFIGTITELVVGGGISLTGDVVGGILGGLPEEWAKPTLKFAGATVLIAGAGAIGTAIGLAIRDHLEDEALVEERPRIWTDLWRSVTEIIHGEVRKGFSRVSITPAIKQGVNNMFLGFNPFDVGFSDPAVKKRLSSIDEQLKQGKFQVGEKRLRSVIDTLVNQGGLTRLEAVSGLAERFDNVSSAKRDGRLTVRVGSGGSLQSKASSFRERAIQETFETISTVDPVSYLDLGLFDPFRKAGVRGGIESTERFRQAIRNVAEQRGKDPSEVTFDEVVNPLGGLMDTEAPPERVAPPPESVPGISPGTNRPPIGTPRNRESDMFGEDGTFDDTPSVMKAPGGANVSFASGDFFASAKDPEDLVKQVLEFSGGLSSQGINVDVEGRDSQIVSILKDVVSNLSELKDLIDDGGGDVVQIPSEEPSRESFNIATGGR